MVGVLCANLKRKPFTAFLLIVMAALGGCATSDALRSDSAIGPAASANMLVAVNRISWGVNSSTMQDVAKLGLPRYIDEQLSRSRALPTAVAEQIAAMTISQQSLVTIVQDMEQRRKDADAIKDDDAKKVAQQAYQTEMNRLAREAATRTLLRATYSPNQLQEQMVWFWMNHFSVHQGKSNNRAMIGDFEESAIRPHTLGKFRELLTATAFHPAMIRYLDNEQNAANRINENYAREIMELHTMGVGGGYSQHDVQDLARILTGVGVNLGTAMPTVKKELLPQYVRAGLFEFNPNRHDFGNKLFLGEALKASGLAEVNEAIERLSRHPATARYVCKKLAMFFVSDAPPAQLIERMATTFTSSDGDIAATLRTLFNSAEFTASLGDSPMAYVAKWRMNVACRKLAASRVSIEQIAADVGYESHAAFNRAFKKFVGESPTAWRARAGA